MSTAGNSFGMLDCMGDVESSNVILHIPHSSTYVPTTQHYTTTMNGLFGEINLLTDHHTNKIFDIDNHKQLVFPVSRIYCDVERFVENEPMEKVGMGFYYTHFDNGSLMREVNEKEQQYILDTYYTPHHDKLKSMVENTLDECDSVLIVDCHSFSDTPFKRDTDKEEKRPDICIGYNSHNITDSLIDEYTALFEYEGYSVKHNTPYSGSMIPLEYTDDERVQSIMIEVNRKLYMKDGIVIGDKVKELNELLSNIIK